MIERRGCVRAFGERRCERVAWAERRAEDDDRVEGLERLAYDEGRFERANDAIWEERSRASELLEESA